MQKSTTLDEETTTSLVAMYIWIQSDNLGLRIELPTEADRPIKA